MGAAVAAVLIRREKEVVDRHRLSVDTRPRPARRRGGDHQVTRHAVAIQSAGSIFRQGIISARLTTLTPPRHYRERHALRHN